MYHQNGTQIFTDTQVGALRMVVAACTLLPFAFKGIRKINSFKTFTALSLVGLCGNFFPAFLFTYSETGISSGYAGMLNSCTPLFALLIGTAVFRDRLNTLQITGVVIGTVGVVLLMLSGQDLYMTGNWTHIGAVVVATICYAISLNVIKHLLPGLKSFEIASLAFLIILLPSILIACFQGAIHTIQTNEHALSGLLAIIILSVFGTAFALVLFNLLIRMSSVLFASSVTYLIPIVAVIIGLYFGETINLYQIIAMCIVITGIFIANVLGKQKNSALSQ